MTSIISPIPTTYSPSAASAQPAGNESSTAEMISSFKEIISSMMLSGGGLDSSQQSNSSITDLMAPLMMMMLLEKLVEGQMIQEPTTATATAENLTQTQGDSQPIPSGRPVGGVLTQEYHTGHNGLDFGVPVGTPVAATMDGKVIYAGWNNQGYGNLVIVENGGYKTYYAHLSSIPIAVGDSVTAGATIGLSGNTGNSTGPHLHYEIRKDNFAIDPTAATLNA